MRIVKRLSLLAAILPALCACRNEPAPPSPSAATPIAAPTPEPTAPVETTFQAAGATITMTVTYPLMIGGAYEVPERQRMLDYLKDGMVVVDAGAHVGYHALPLAKATPGGKVYAIEPAGDSYGHLVANAARNNCRNLIPLKVAVGDRAASLSLFLDAGNTGNNSLAQANTTSPSGQTEIVPVETLDALLAHEPRIDLIKLDIQGAEFAALRGARGILARDHPALMIEFWPLGLRSFGEDPADLLRFLADLGYTTPTVWVIAEKQWRARTPHELFRVLQGRAFRNLWMEADKAR